jgi:hypothetical protein
MLATQITNDSDLCWMFIDNAFKRLKQRHKSIAAASPIEFGRDSASLGSKRPHTALRFCAMLALGDFFKDMRVLFAPHSMRGYLFERLAENALQELFPRWKTVRTGWAPNHPASMDTLVQVMAEELQEGKGKPEYWSPRHAKDEGLDLCCYYPFEDMHAGYPVYLIQCATGIHWREKIEKPNVENWKKYVDFTCSPRKGFIIPFALTKRDFRTHCNGINGPLLDRYRLLSFDTPEKDWLPTDLADELESWLAPRIDSLRALGQ